MEKVIEKYKESLNAAYLNSKDYQEYLKLKSVTNNYTDKICAIDQKIEDAEKLIDYEKVAELSLEKEKLQKAMDILNGKIRSIDLDYAVANSFIDEIKKQFEDETATKTKEVEERYISALQNLLSIIDEFKEIRDCVNYFDTFLQTKYKYRNAINVKVPYHYDFLNSVECEFHNFKER